ncbi:MAG: hypothetical protein RI958_1788 [Actinomycetota bacterium]
MASLGIETVLIGAHAAILLAETDYQRAAMERAQDGVLTVEDVIVHKLIAGRPRDMDDIRSILSTGIRFDEHAVVENARQWEVVDRWLDVTGRHEH